MRLVEALIQHLIYVRKGNGDLVIILNVLKLFLIDKITIESLEGI